MTAREEILTRIATAHQAAPPLALSYAGLQREYRTTSSLDAAELTKRLVARLVDYKALVHQCTADELPATVAAALSERGVTSLVVSAGLPEGWLRELSGEVAVHVDGTDPHHRLSVADLDSLDGVLSACAVAVAETGTLVLNGGAGQGRRVISLVPDYHLCVVEPEQICADVPQAVSRLDLTRPTTMISGPSATSDIELNRVEGVHGPRTLEVVLVAAATHPHDLEV